METEIARRGQNEDEIVLALLDAVENDPAVTQRSVARELGIALGLANAYLKRCARKGFIKINQIPRRRYAYYLTPQGFAEKSRLTAQYLMQSFAFFRRARTQCGDVFRAAIAKGQRRLALIGDTDLAEIAILVAREHPVEIVGFVPASSDAGILLERVNALGGIDAVVITALENSRHVFDAALVAFGAANVYAPDLLRARVAPKTRLTPENA